MEDDDHLPRIAVLGAGPMGLEAALYARYLGYDVEVYERGRIAENIVRCAALPMPAPIRQFRSMLGLAALAAHDPTYQPDDAATSTCGEWLRVYLWPLAQTDLLVDIIHEQTTVTRMERARGETAGRLDAEGDEYAPFQVWLMHGPDQQLREVLADVVIDATGISEHPVSLGSDIERDRFDNGVASGYYVIGAKSVEPGQPFAFATGLDQIRQIFAEIGERDTLNLYAQMDHLVPRPASDSSTADG